MFADEVSLVDGSWRAFERCVARLLLSEGFEGVRLVSQPGDRGADVIAQKAGRRFLVQAKHWRKRVGLDVVDETMRAMSFYRAQVPVVVSLGGFEDAVRLHQRSLHLSGIPLQLIDRSGLLQRMRSLPSDPPTHTSARDYQEAAILEITRSFFGGERRAMVVMATGLGKTYTAAEAIRRICSSRRGMRVLVLAHANELVYQLERAFWPMLGNSQRTLIWNGIEPSSISQIDSHDFVFACSHTVFEYRSELSSAKAFDIVLVDECHHAMSDHYREIIAELRAGEVHGPFLLGLTATPFRADERDPADLFGPPSFTLDLLEGMRRGYLANVDYRLHTDNIDWKRLQDLEGERFSPKNINRTLFISEWDDAVVNELRRTWPQVRAPRAIVFCGTIQHALMMRDKVNSLAFCKAEALYSQDSDGRLLPAAERNRILCDFHDGQCQVLCAVDILNEGIDVPDVNILVFQRVTHSRRIFIQQLGRGLRLAPGKESVVVLDFVSDIRRFAAGFEMQQSLAAVDGGRTTIASIGHKITFKRAGADDARAQRFLSEWLTDFAELQDRDDEAALLRFPPVELLTDG